MPISQTQTMDLHNDSDPAIVYAANGDSWTIATGVTVSTGAGNEPAIHSLLKERAIQSGQHLWRHCGPVRGEH